MTNKTLFKTKLPLIVKALKEGYRPQKIILFGSMLDQKQESNDIDLFLIKNTSLTRLGWRAEEARKFLPNTGVPVDLLVYTPQEIKDEIARGNVFISEVINNGQTLYDQAT